MEQAKRVEVVRRYLATLSGGDPAALAELFTPDGAVVSPLVGKVPAGPFFAQLAHASQESRLDVVDLMVSADEGPRVAAYFQYRWTLRDGPVVTFDCCDIFEFAEGTEEPLVRLLTIIYDAAPVRAQLGDRYR
jgi:ketosteroid isomerase-like protein